MANRLASVEEKLRTVLGSEADGLDVVKMVDLLILKYHKSKEGAENLRVLLRNANDEMRRKDLLITDFSMALSDSTKRIEELEQRQ